MTRGSSSKMPLGGHDKSSNRLPSSEELEVDLYRDPTLLGHLILGQKFLSASKRLRKYPEEASIWLTAKRSTFPHSPPSAIQLSRKISRQDSWPLSRTSLKRQQTRGDNSLSISEPEYKIRQLPLHMACQFLSLVSRQDDRREECEKLEQLIRSLVSTNTLACSQPDHHGRLPLHEAIAWKASPTTISQILMGFPEAMHQRDASGLLPVELHHRATRPDSEAVTQVLQQGYRNWEQSRNEAMMRLELGLGGVSDEAADATIALTKDPPRKAIAGMNGFDGVSNGRDGSPRSSDSSLGSSSDDKMFHMQQVMTDLYNRNQHLTDDFQSLMEERKQSAIHERSVHSRQAMYKLEDENADLKRRLQRRELVLHDAGFDASGNNLAMNDERTCDNEQRISMMSMDPDPPTVLTKYLETKVGELADENDHLEGRNEEFQIQIEVLQKLVEELNSTEEPQPITAMNEGLLKEREISISSEKEHFLAGQIAELQLQLMEAHADNALLRDAKFDDSTSKSGTIEGSKPLQSEELRSVSDNKEESMAHEVQTPPKKPRAKMKRCRSREEQLIDIDRKSGHGTEPFMPVDNEEFAGGESIVENHLNKEEELLNDGHESFQTGIDSEANISNVTGKASHISKQSTTSWGMLSLAQNSQRKTLRKKWSTPTPFETFPHGGDSKSSFDSFRSFQTEAFHDSVETSGDRVEADNLEDWYKSAASLFHNDKVEKQRFDGNKSAAIFNTTALRRKRNKKTRRNSDGGASSAIMGTKKTTRNSSEKRNDPLAETARLLVAEEAIGAIIKETETLLSMGLSAELVTALREASLHCVATTDKLGGEKESLNTAHFVAESLIDYRLIGDTEKLYRRSMPADVVSALRVASIHQIETSRQEIEAMETMKKRLEQELLDALIETAQIQFHKSLPVDVMISLRGAAATFRSLLLEEFSEEGHIVSIRLNFRELDRMFAQAQKALGRPFSQELIVALRRASFVLQSRLEGTDFSGAHDASAGAKSGNKLSPSRSRSDRRSVTALAIPNRLLGSPPSSSDGRNGSDRSSPEKHSELEDVTSITASKTSSSHHIGLQFSTLYRSPSAEILMHDTSRDAPIDGDSGVARFSESFGTGRSNVSIHSREGHSQRKTRSKSEGGQDPGVIYRVARARSRSPTSSTSGNLDTIYDKAILARTRSPSPESIEDLGQLFRKASLGRTSDHVDQEEDSDAATKMTSEESGRNGSSWLQIETNINPSTHPKRQTSFDSEIPFSISPSLDDSGVIQMSTSLTKDDTTHSEFESIVKAAKDVLGRDIPPDLLDALRLLSQASAKSQEKESKPILRKSSYASSGIRSSAFDEEENEEMKSTDMSRQSDISLNLSAVFNPGQTSELERKLKNLDQPRRATSSSSAESTTTPSPSTYGVKTVSQEKAMKQLISTDPVAQVRQPRGRSLARGVRKTKSGDIDLLSSTKARKQAVNFRRRKSTDDIESLPAQLKIAARQDPMERLAARSGTDNLEQLYKHAVEKVDEDTSLLASTCHIPQTTGVAAFETIISDTEETYGIEIPSNIVDALRRATMGNMNELPLLSIVRALHDEDVIRAAEGYIEEPIPVDLIAAICSTSLPPGVSVETLRPFERSTSILARNRYNTSLGSMGLSLNLTDSSSRRSYSTRTASRRESSSSRQSSALQAEAIENGNSSTEIWSITSLLSQLSEDNLANETSERSKNIDSSVHSDNSWGKLSMSKSPVVNRKRGDRKTTKKHMKGTKEAMFERAQKRREKAAEFMNSLSDFGADDLVDLYKEAKQTLESSSSSMEIDSKQLHAMRVATPQDAPSYQPLESVLEGETSYVSILSMAEGIKAIESPALTLIPRPSHPKSCIAVSPQEAELDMLLSKFMEIAGRQIPFSIDMALRKALRSMDESLDETAPWKYLSEHCLFGTQLATEKLEIIYSEAELFLGKDIDEGIIETLIGASHELLLQLHGSSSVVTETSIISVEMGSSDLSKLKATESLMSVSQGDEDDLSQLYKVAYAKSPHEAPQSPPKQQIGFVASEFSTPSKKGKRKVKASSRAIPRKPSPNRSPVTPSYGGIPFTQVDPSEDEMELTESGRFVVALSPMTEASVTTIGSTLHNSGNMMDMVDIAKAHLRALSAAPRLDDSEALLDYQENLGDETEASLNDEDSASLDESISLGGEYDGTLTNESSQTSIELDAILFEAQEEYGMDLPPELVEALKAASVANLHDFESVHGSAVSSLIMQSIEFEEDKSGEGSFRGLVMEVREKLSKSENIASRHVARRWKIEEFLMDLIQNTQKILGRDMSTAVVEALRNAVIRQAETENLMELRWGNIKDILDSLDHEIQAHLSKEVVVALQKASEEVESSVDGQASGYFSAVSDTEEVSVLDDEFAGYDDYTEEIMQELKNIDGDPLEEMLQRKSSYEISEGSTVLEHSTDLAGVRFSGSTTLEYSIDLEYSESTLASLPASSAHSQSRIPVIHRKTSQTSGYVSASNEDSLSRINENERLTELDIFLIEAAQEYGQPLPEALIIALKQISVSSGLTWDAEFDAGAAIRRSEALGTSITPEMVGALERAASKSLKSLSKHLSRGRQNSVISALSGHTAFSTFSKRSSPASLNTDSSSTDWPAEEDDKDNVEDDVNCDDDDSATAKSFASDKESTGRNTSPPPPPPPPLPPPPSDTPLSTGAGSASSKASAGSKNLGLSLLKEVKKIYNKKIPLELSYVMGRSKVLPNAMNTDEEIQIILDECEEMSGKRLPADLVLALREASVAVRAPPSVSKSRRSKLMRQGSGSFRSTSRSSGMPSIQEWATSTVTDGPCLKKAAEKAFEFDRVPSSFGPLAIPAEIAAEERSNMDMSTLKDSQHTEGTSTKLAKPTTKNEPYDILPVDPSRNALQGQKSASMQPVPEYSEHSIGIDALFGPATGGANKKGSSASYGYNSFALSASGSIQPASPGPGASPNPTFNASAATMQVSNMQNLKVRKKWIPPLSVAYIEDQEEVLAHKIDLSAMQSRSMGSSTNDTSEHGGSVVSTGSSTSTEVTANNSNPVSALTDDDASQTSTLPSRKLPIGVNPVPLLDGVETDDLSAIFKEAARRLG